MADLLQDVWRSSDLKLQLLMGIIERSKPTQNDVFVKGVCLTPLCTRRKSGSWTENKFLTKPVVDK